MLSYNNFDEFCLRFPIIIAFLLLIGITKFGDRPNLKNYNFILLIVLKYKIHI